MAGMDEAMVITEAEDMTEVGILTEMEVLTGEGVLTGAEVITAAEVLNIGLRESGVCLISPGELSMIKDKGGVISTPPLSLRGGWLEYPFLPPLSRQVLPLWQKGSNCHLPFL
jgi:hypothetical protein